MRILISGATGFVGSALSFHLQSSGHEVVPLARGASAAGVEWDAVIHLAGEPISFSRWSVEKRRKILSSRTVDTRRLIEQFTTLPKIFISASAVGFYGDRGEELLTESSRPGNGFLSHVCLEWEKASLPLKRGGVRCVQARFGVVLGSGGGALQKMIPIYKLGLGATLGDGKQWVSWVALPDLVEIVEHLLLDEAIEGPVNVVSPNAVRQEEFSKTLASLLHRPAWFKIPKWVLRGGLGVMAEEVLLASAHVRPAKLLDAGFTFRYTRLEDILKFILLR